MSGVILMPYLCWSSVLEMQQWWVCKELIVASTYFQYDSYKTPPTKKMRDITDHCQSRKKQIIIGCDANEHHILWGSICSNPKGESLIKFLVSLSLNILNRVNKPTFVVRSRKEVIDLTLGTNKIGDLVSNWHVSDELSLSDHRYICFQIGNITTNYVTFRNPKRTKWEPYNDDLKANLEIISRKICTKKDRSIC
jgi:hypothetical protein